MTVLKAHFDGKVLVPDEPVSLPVNCPLEVHVHPVAGRQGTGDHESEGAPLQRLAEVFSKHPSPPNAMTNGAAQHDHYLYGMPKK